MLLVGSNEIGGGYVRLAFSDATRRYKVGEELTAEKIKSFHNHRAMIKTGHISVYPPSARTTSEHAAIASGAAPLVTHKMHDKRHVVSAGFGRFDVFEGRKLNDKPLSKEQAEALAAGNFSVAAAVKN